MAGHSLTPYRITATKKRARGAAKDRLLSLSDLTPDDGVVVDFVDVVSDHLLAAPPIESRDKSQSTRCLALRLRTVRKSGNRVGRVLDMVFAVDRRGERRPVEDPETNTVVFEQLADHSARYYALASIYLADGDGTTATLILHRPWGQGVSRRHVERHLNKCFQLSGHPVKPSVGTLVTDDVIKQTIRTAKESAVVYKRRTRARNMFNEARADGNMEFRVGGKQATAEFLNGFAQVLRDPARRDELLSIHLPGIAGDEDGQGEEDDLVHFDDAVIAFEMPDGTVRHYSIERDNMPSISFDVTGEINDVYFALPAKQYDVWPDRLITGCAKHLLRLAEQLS